jgi:hypothetical protein
LRDHLQNVIGVPTDAVLTRPKGLSGIADTSTMIESREDLIRRRWSETGRKLWNLQAHGNGLVSLRIQGAASNSSTNPQDCLEFRLVRASMGGYPMDSIVCEGVIVDPPLKRGAPD